ncbi:MAG TPA: DUF982 domain-containing protein [Mycoplana sp.]|jgi:hypothetical protein|nr:DUF982 domain-containing protein [Mycoplana sp.]
MHVGPWSECVAVRIGDRIEFVSNTRQALDLLENWPAPHSPASQGALGTCQEVLLGHSPAYLARIAFDAAAKERGIRL